MIPQTLALFGEAQKGRFATPLFIHSPKQLMSCVGMPSKTSQGIRLAVEILLHQQRLLFFRVHDEGFSLDDYLRGFYILQHRSPVKKLSALCLPGVGTQSLLQQALTVLHPHGSLLILEKKDLYDYLTLLA